MAEEKSTRKGSVFTYLLIAVAGLGMVFIGVPVLNRQGNSRNIAAINGEDIPTPRFNRVFSAVQQQFTTLPREQLQEMALARLIDETLLRQHALASGYQLSDQALYEEVKARFGDNETYEKWLRQNTISARDYEASLGDTLAVQEYYRLLDSATITSRAELSLLLSLLAEKRDMSVITLPLAEKAKKVTVTENDLNAFYDAHKADYMSAEKVSLRYVILDSASLVPLQSVTDAEIAAEKDAISKAERRDGRYVLFADPASANTAETKIRKGEQTFDDIYLTIAQGEIEGEADKIEAHKNGEGPSAEVDRQLFALQKAGDTSALFDTDYGPMLVSLGAIEAEKTPDTSELRRRIGERKSKEAYHRLANEAFDKASDDGTLEEIAKLTDTQVHTLSEITATTHEPEWLDEEKIRRALFGKNAVSEDTIAEPLELDDNRSVFYQIDQRITAQRLPYERVAQQVEKDYRQVTAKAELEKAATEIVAAMNKGQAIETLLAANDGKIEEYKNLGRFNASNEPSPALTMTLLAQNQRVAQNEDSDGNIVISEIKHIVAGETPVIAENIRRDLVAQLSIRRNIETEQGFARWLRSRAKISVNRERFGEKPE